jgi:hypothetical protein
MQTQSQTSPNSVSPEHVVEAEVAIHDAARARRAWKACEAEKGDAHIETIWKRQRYASLAQRADVLSHEAAEIEGAAS